MAYHHVVLFRLHPEVTDANRAEAVDLLHRLGDVALARSWRVEESVDRRKGHVIVQLSAFDDADAFEVFRAHPAHVAAGEHMAQISDWLVGDFLD